MENANIRRWLHDSKKKDSNTDRHFNDSYAFSLWETVRRSLFCHETGSGGRKIRSLGIVMQGWYPLGGRGYTAELLGNEVISEIAQAHGKSSAQVILHWNLQKGVVVISGSSSPEHINSSKMSGSGDGLAVWVEQSYNNTVVKLKTSGFPAALPLVGVHFL